MKKEKLSTRMLEAEGTSMRVLDDFYGLSVLIDAYAKQVATEKTEHVKTSAESAMSFVAEAIHTFYDVLGNEIGWFGDCVEEVEALEKKAAEAKE